MMEFLVFVIGGLAGVYCYNHSKRYRVLVDGKGTGESEDNEDR